MQRRRSAAKAKKDEQVWCKAVNKASAAKEQAEARKQTNRMSSKTIIWTAKRHGVQRCVGAKKEVSLCIISDIGHVRANGRNSHVNTLVRLRTFRMSLTSP